ncbi:MAG: YbaB/EbfC family nucleoid-associated protein [Dehalococcoidales bacterium]|nr:YbaB/EbfC family nucleoid-associated protein [Dehalococcoidales bacterium]
MNLDMIRQAQQLKSKLDHAQKELKKMQIEGDYNKGAIKIVMNGEQKVISVKIDTNLVDVNNTKQLEQSITRAMNETQEKVIKIAAQSLKEATGGLKIPGLF